MSEKTFNNIDDIVKAATEEYRHLNEKNVEILSNLCISIDDLAPGEIDILKLAVKYQMICGVEELSEEKFRIWYMQKILNDSKHKMEELKLSQENKKVMKQIREETEASEKMLKGIEEMEKQLMQCSEKNVKEAIWKIQAEIENNQERFDTKFEFPNPNLEIPAIEERIEELEALRVELERQTKIDENEKFLESCKNLLMN